MKRTLTIFVFTLVFSLGCANSSPPTLTPMMEDEGVDGEVDAGNDNDSTDSSDRRVSADLGVDSTEAGPDGGTDALPPDAGVDSDASGSDAEGADAEVPDAGTPDALAPDAEGADAGVPDTLAPDAGPPAPYCADPLGCWEPMSDVGAPDARREAVAVWTGSEMIVWAGVTDNVSRSDGGRYDPITDSWRAMSVEGAPSPRYYFSTVWTGSEMIVWGGRNEDPWSSFNNGARYNPATDRWTPITTTDAPSARNGHTAVWTGSEMIVWGGVSPCCVLPYGGRYNPVADTWIGFSGDATTLAPSGADGAVWTGSDMIFWNNVTMWGSRFDLSSGTWSGMSTAGAPSERIVVSPIWTGSEMLVWAGGGFSVPAEGGGRYDPLSNTWSAMSSIGAPVTPRATNTAVWTGSEMIVWGGGTPTATYGDGGRYDPVANSWSAVQTTGVPTARGEHSAVWATDCVPDLGDQPCMIVCGGYNGSHLRDGGRYFLP